LDKLLLSFGFRTQSEQLEVDAQTYLDQITGYIEALEAGRNITFEEFLRQSR